MHTSERREDLKGGASRFISVVGMIGLIVGLGGFAWRSARAEIQNDAIGFTPNHVFESANDGEHIDAMTGNMTLTIPIGPRFKLTDDFSWGLTLTYNSKIWEHDCPLSSTPLPSDVCLGTLSSHRRLFDPDYPNDPTHATTEPSTYAFGLGWTMKPGRIYHNPADKTYVYHLQLEDGSDHMFCDAFSDEYNDEYPRRYPGHPDLRPNCGFTTVDSSHITMGKVGSGIDERWTAQLPDGRTIEFGTLGVSGETTVAYASRVTTTAKRPDGSPRAWVDYTSNPIRDSQGHMIAIGGGGGHSTIQFNGYTDALGRYGGDIVYEIDTASLSFKDPTDRTYATPAQTNYSDTVITAIRFPAPNDQIYQYSFGYELMGRMVRPSRTDG